MPVYFDHKTRGKHKNCPTCGHPMKRLYIKQQVNKIKTMLPVGWWCMKCSYVEIQT